jgi:uroporphyrinogen-III decarboxylase
MSMINLMTSMVKALVKGKLHVGTLTGLERVLLSQFSLPDRVPTLLAATNIEPYLIDGKFNYVLLSESPEANLELFARVKERFDFDTVVVPVWMGTLTVGAAELGTRFRIEEKRVPYPVDYPIQDMEDVRRMQIPQTVEGYQKMYFDINLEAQRRFPDTLIFPVFDGPWDLAMLLRGDHHLPMDFRLYKDFIETEDPVRKEKIQARGDPYLWPAIMELTTKLSIRYIQLAKEYGLNMLGVMLIDQFAAKPVLSMEDFLTYVLPYIERVWRSTKGKIGLGYMLTAPHEIEALMDHPVLGPGLGVAGFTNYIFPQNPDGVTLPEYDQPMLELAKKYNKSYSYIVHGKFLRDATQAELEGLIQRVCGMAVEMKAKMQLSLSSVPPGTDLEKVDLVLELVKKYGRYAS